MLKPPLPCTDICDLMWWTAADMVLEERLIAEQIFVLLTEEYNAYKKAQEAGWLNWIMLSSMQILQHTLQPDIRCWDTIIDRDLVASSAQGIG